MYVYASIYVYMYIYRYIYIHIDYHLNLASFKVDGLMELLNMYV